MDPLHISSTKDYLGDSVYIQEGPQLRGEIILTTENGEYPSNVIYMDPSVVRALLSYLNTHGYPNRETT